MYYGNMSKKRLIKIITLMCVLGTCMHFVCDIITNETAVKILGIVFPVNESSWEHMKMIWYPFIVTGIVLGIKEKNKAYIGAFTLAGLLEMCVQLGSFAFYQSFTGKSVLAIDIVSYLGTMIVLALLAFLLSTREWLKKTWIIWVIVAAIVTIAIIYITYNPGMGYVFLDDNSF